FSIVFTLMGVFYARRHLDTIEDYVVARNTQSTAATTLTLMATSLGAWILFAPIPLWLTALIVLFSTLIYTSYGGLRASIFTDKIQMAIIVPLLGLLIYFAWQAVGDINTIKAGLRHYAPELLNWNATGGMRAGATFFVAILLTGLFHQGNWQRIYAAKSRNAMRCGFLLAGILVAPIIAIMGLFGLAFVASGSQADSSIALF